MLLIFIGGTIAQAQSLQSFEEATGKISREEKKDWHNGYIKNDKVYGTGANKALSEILEGQSPKRKTVVAIIDSGVDTEHEDLQENLWVNADEVAENGKDDDGNGYIDDVHGWNFLVDGEGNDIGYDNLEATRVLRISKQAEMSGDASPEWLTKELLQDAAKIYNENNAEAAAMEQFSTAWKMIDSTAQAVLNKEDYTMEEMKAVDAGDNDDIKTAKKLFAIFRTLGISKKDLSEMGSLFDKMNAYYLNMDFNPRAGYTPDDFYYGNNHYKGEHAEHGTHVAGIVAANRTNDLGARGIAGGNAEIMVVRAVPDGDERDMDVAAAIRYAADNGAHIINMSFGKGLSPKKGLVYEALEYATAKGVLVIHAAGNDASNNDDIMNYPNHIGLSAAAKGRYLTIGALSPTKKKKKLLATFSNYGRASVDLFAPGEDIYSTLPDNDYGFLSGTSMAAPAAAGAAALIWAYHPSLSADALKQLLIDTGIDLGKKKVRTPGSKDKMRFNEITSTGKVVNAYGALLQLSEQP
jgi:subtilisin family serine protease